MRWAFSRGEAKTKWTKFNEWKSFSLWTVRNRQNYITNEINRHSFTLLCFSASHWFATFLRQCNERYKRKPKFKEAETKTSIENCHVTVYHFPKTRCLLFAWCQIHSFDIFWSWMEPNRNERNIISVWFYLINSLFGFYDVFYLLFSVWSHFAKYSVFYQRQMYLNDDTMCWIFFFNLVSCEFMSYMTLVVWRLFFVSIFPQNQSNKSNEKQT